MENLNVVIMKIGETYVILCGRKIIFGKIQLVTFFFNENTEKLFKKFIAND